MAPPSQVSLQPPKRPLDPFRRAVLRGLAVLLPPLLTIVIFVWVYNTVITYMLEPMERHARSALLTYATDIQPSTADAHPYDKEDDGQVEYYLIDDQPYMQTDEGRYVPLDVYQAVRKAAGHPIDRLDAKEVYRAYIDEEYLNRWFVVPVFVGVLVLVLYLLGKFLAAGVGRFLWGQLERVITRLPLVSKVYSSVKQVTDFMFSDTTIKATRVVAIEYPRRGIWTLALVTGESMLDIRAAANEPVLSVLVPTSPMPFTGFTMTVRKSETIDLNITIDQAIQFIVSCGVVVPPGQVASDIEERDRLILPDSAHPPAGPNLTPPSE